MANNIANLLKPSQLRLLMNIVDTGQLQVAARMSAMSQPAASRSLATIEGLAGGALFLRHPNGMEPTPLGSIFIRHATVVLDALNELASETALFATGAIGHVRIGAVSGPTVGALTPAVRRIKSESPELELTIEVGPSSELVRGLTENRFDFVIARLPSSYDSRDFRLHPARSEEVSFLVNPDHPLAAKRGVALAETLQYEWVMQDLGSPIREVVEAAFHRHNLPTPNRVINSSSLIVALSLLDDPGVIAPQSREVADMLALGPLQANLAILDFAKPVFVSPCFVIEHRNRPLNKAVDRVIAELLATSQVKNSGA